MSALSVVPYNNIICSHVENVLCDAYDPYKRIIHSLIFVHYIFSSSKSRIHDILLCYVSIII